VAQQHLGQLRAVDRALIESTQVRLELAEELRVRRLEQVWAVEPVRFEDGVGEELALARHLDVRDALHLLDHVLLPLIPDRHLQPVGHALGALDEQAGTLRRLEGRRTEAGEARGLEALALQRDEGDREEDALDGVEGREVNGHGGSPWRLRGRDARRDAGRSYG
jgi:hypothetical protein